ncbi:MAG TPA: helix-turn-helix domain-containing protein [Micromonospora sp.]
MDTQAGLRERKKAATRQALHEAAVRLAMAHGFERLTVEAIADAAMVSRRTFSNYFCSKEEALLYGERLRMRRLVELVRERPADEPIWVALSHAAEQLTIEEGEPDPRWLAQWRKLREHPPFVAHRLAVYAAVERDLAAEITMRLSDIPQAALRARVLAATYLTMLRVATQQWMDQPDRPLVDVIRETLAYAEPRAAST